MRFPISSCLLVGSVLLTAVAAQQERDSELDTRNQSIVDALSLNDDLIVASHHLLLPAVSPLRQVLEDKSQIYTVFMANNRAKLEEEHWVDEMWCEASEIKRADGKFKRRVKNQMAKGMAKEILGGREWRKIVEMTDDDCDNLSRLIELDEKVVRDVERLRAAGHDDKTHKHQLKLMLRENEDAYRNLHFSPEVEKFVLAKRAYTVVPGRVDTTTIQPNSKKTFDTLLSKPELLPIYGYESNTRLVLKKGREGQMIVFASPRAPFWRVRFDEQPIEAVNGLIYVTHHFTPYPATVSQSLIYNKLFFTAALLKYTGLLNKLDERKDITVIAPTNEAWRRILPQIIDKSTIRYMVRQMKQRYDFINKLPFFKQFEQQQEEDEDRVVMRRSADEESEPEDVEWRMEATVRIKPQEVESEVIEPEFESPRTRRFIGLGKRSLRSLLMDHILPGVHFSDDLTRFDTITAMSGVNIKVKAADTTEDNFIIGQSHTVFSDIPIKQGAMHIVDGLATSASPFAFKLTTRHF